MYRYAECVPKRHKLPTLRRCVQVVMLEEVPIAPPSQGGSAEVTSAELVYESSV